MKRNIILAIILIPILLVSIAVTILLNMPGLKSDLTVGLGPETHSYLSVNVRDFTEAPLNAEVKVFLPISSAEAMAIVADFSAYETWVSPPPKTAVIVDNSRATGETFGVGSHVSYSEGETDIIEYFDQDTAMIAKPLWGTNDFEGHRGVVIVVPHQGGVIVHMRRYFETKSMKGVFMSKMMPMFMKSSAQNLADIHNGEVL